MKAAKLLNSFEQATGCNSFEASELLGLAYPRYMEFKREARELKPYHLASIEAHLLLPRTKLLERKAAACSPR